MRNLSFFFWASLLVDGVFGVENVTVSVMKGDSATLKNQIVIPAGDSAEWWFDDTIIAKKKAVGLFSTSEGDDGRFKNCLNLDKQTGSLTITNITPDHAGLYKLQIMSRNETSKIFSVTVTDDVTSLSVMEGDTVTLHTGVTDIPRELIQWKFGKQDLNGPDDKNWRNGDLTIRNIRSDQSGEYELKINTSSVILHMKLHINIRGEMKTVSVKEGESFTLDTGLIEIKRYDLILWKFKDQLIAELSKKNNSFLKTDGSDERFKGRLQLHPTIVSLIIGNSRITDSGDYQLKMSNSTYTVQRNISVAVSGVFSVDVSVMEGGSVILNPHTVIPEDETALWWFGNKIIAKINKADEIFSTSEGDDGRFKDKLNLDKQTGSLTITNITPDNAGLYKLKIMSRTETFKIFSVTVTVSDKQTPDPGRSIGDVAAIVLGVLLLVFAAAVVIYYLRRKISELQRPRHKEKNGTNDPLKGSSANSDDL